MFENILCKVLFVCAFDFGKAVEHLFVAHIVLKFLQSVGVFEPFVADKLVDKACKARICLRNPSSVRDAVGDVGKLFGVHTIVLREDVVFENVAVERTDAVYRVRSDKAEICHLNLPV